MKNPLLYLATCLLLFISSCKKDKLSEVEPVAATFQLNFSTATKDLGLSIANAEITLTNKTDGAVNKAKADTKGVVKFESITPGNYSVVASLTISAATYTAATGAYVAQDIAFNGSMETNIVANSGTLSITLQAGRLGDWVIKQVYYGGSSTSTGAIFRDQFIELYNNSNEILYADSLYISMVHGKNTKVSSIDLTDATYQSNGQFNWANSVNMQVSNANTDYVYLKTLYMIPGTGKQYPVQPGSSIIIAQNAQNHKTSYVGPTGTTYSVKDPSLTIDLSGADFEVYYGDVPGTTLYASDLDNPLVPNLKVLNTGYMSDMVMNANGYEGIVIFKSTTDPLLLPTYADPESKTVTTSTKVYMQLPISSVIDAVDIAHTTASSRAAKRMPDAIDAGFAFTAGGSYSSQSIIRKTSTTADGRRILKDTNNSTNDFDYLTLADVTKTVFK